jgi:uncharacterized protein (TIGR02996 family)
MDNAAYLRAICWSPFDDGPRLVYADKLDERGECARAEFIRVQCELEWLESDRGDDGRTWKPSELKRRDILRRRERELLLSPPPGSAYSRAEFWTPTALSSGAVACEVSTHPPTFRSLLSGMAWDFRRGLVAAVTLTAAQFFGGPCEKCEGRGYTLPGADSFLVERKGCSACGGDSWKDGTGRVEGLAAALFRVAPITEVRLSDREPFTAYGQETGVASWYNPAALPPLAASEDHPSNLPAELFRLLEGGDHHGNNFGRWYESPTDAHAALSAAAVALGRARGEMPALVRGGRGPRRGPPPPPPPGRHQPILRANSAANSVPFRP